MERPVQSRNSFFGFFLLLLAGCTEMPATVNLSDENFEKKQGVCYYANEPYSGVLLEYTDKGQLVAEIVLKEGKKSGTANYYWPNGKLKRTANYLNDVYHGEVVQYYETGELFSKFNYTNGQESGKQQMWKSDGRIKVNYEVINGRKYGLTGVKNCVNVLEEEGHLF